MRNTLKLIAQLLTALAILPICAWAGPTYTDDGRLKRPDDYREWIFVTSGLDMSYRDRPPSMSMFDNVFVNPDAYQAFKATGHWPNGTVLVMEVRGAQTKGSINQRGSFQDESMMGLEVHVRDQRFKENASGSTDWGFFSFDDNQPATKISTRENCYSCHAEHGAVDTTFVQFYPSLAPIARQHGSFHEATTVPTVQN